MPASNDLLLLQKALQVAAPWVVRKYVVAPEKALLDVWIGLPPKKGWLGGIKPPPGELQWEFWWHLNLMGWRTRIHWLAANKIKMPRQPWAQQEAVPLSIALAYHTAGMMARGLDQITISSLTGLAATDVWKLKHALDTKLTHIEGVVLPAPPSGTRPTASPATTRASYLNVPPATDPIWLDLLMRNVALDIRHLSLKLFLTPLQWQINEHPEESWREGKVRELHQFFEKNARQLRHELSQLQAKGA